MSDNQILPLRETDIRPDHLISEQRQHYLADVGCNFDVQVLGMLPTTVDAEHLNYFHPAALTQLTELCGFDVLMVTPPGKVDAELVRKKVLEGQYDISDQPFSQQVLIDEWDRVGDAFQTFLANHLLSSHMWLVGRKKESQ